MHKFKKGDKVVFKDKNNVPYSQLGISERTYEETEPKKFLIIRRTGQTINGTETLDFDGVPCYWLQDWFKLVEPEQLEFNFDE